MLQILERSKTQTKVIMESIIILTTLIVIFIWALLTIWKIKNNREIMKDTDTFLTKDHMRVIINIVTKAPLNNNGKSRFARAINRISFETMLDKEYVRFLLYDLKNTGLVDYRIGFDGAKKWMATKPAYERVRNHWDHFLISLIKGNKNPYTAYE